MSTPALLEETKTLLTNMQTIDSAALVREAELGRTLSFAAAVDPANRLIALYKRVPLSTLDDMADAQLTGIKTNAQADWNTFGKISTFDPEKQPDNPIGHRNSLIETLTRRRDEVFNALWVHIAYAVARATDTAVLEAEARGIVADIKKQSDGAILALNKSKGDADGILIEIRKVAAEQGVSQQAHWFKDEADTCDANASYWLTRTYWFAGAVGAFAVLSILIHKVPFFAPTSIHETVQLIGSKALIFTILLYMLILAARNFASNRHNAVVNRHRQNALLTYKTLTEAAKEPAAGDIILANAAACIFSPQDSGYNVGSKEGPGGGAAPRSVLELLTKGSSKSGET